MTPEQLRILKTLPKVIEAVRAFQAEADELRGLLAPPGDGLASGAALQMRAGLPVEIRPPAPPVLRTLQAVPDPEADATRKAAEAELARRQAERTPEQVEADKFLEANAGQRASLLAAILPGGKP